MRQAGQRIPTLDMLSGKHFKIIHPTTGMEVSNNTDVLVTIPADSCIRVLSGPYGHDLHDKRLVHVLWEERIIALFAVDVEARGIEIKEPERVGLRPYKSARA